MKRISQLVILQSSLIFSIATMFASCTKWQSVDTDADDDRHDTDLALDSDTDHGEIDTGSPDADVLVDADVHEDADVPMDADHRDSSEDADRQGDAEQDTGPTLSYADVVLEDSPIAYFRFDEPDGVSIVTDYDDVYEGTIVSLVQLGVPGLIADDNTAAWFNGERAAIDFGDVLDLAGATAFTFEIWMQVEDKSVFWHRVFWKAGEVEGEGERGYHVSIIDHTLAFVARGANGSTVLTLENPDLDQTLSENDNVLHVVWTHDGVNMRLFVNGEMTSIHSSNVELPDTDFELAIGAHVTGYGTFEGTLDELAIYDYGLLPDRVALHYQVGQGL